MSNHPSTRNIHDFDLRPDPRIGIPLQGPIAGPTIEGELAEARAIIARLDDETDTLRAEKAALEHTVNGLEGKLDQYADRIVSMSDTIAAYQQWTGSILPQRTEHNDAPTYDELLRRIANAKQALDGLLPGEQ